MKWWPCSAQYAIANPADFQQYLIAMTFKADLLLKPGKDQQAVNALDTVLRGTDLPKVRRLVLKLMAIGDTPL